MKKNISVNAILNMVKTALSVLFPIITVPYLSRVLGKNEYGSFNYSLSIISYFVLLAGLGFSIYAIREGSRIRENKEAIIAFSNELFSLNIISTLISYGLLFFTLSISKQLSSYKELILILSISIIFTTLGADWVNSIYEDYIYITVRYILIQVLALILMFVFVKSDRDVVIYTYIYLFTQIGANVINIFYIRKYVHLKFTFSKSMFKHLLPVLGLFISNFAVTLYVNSDITLLGILKGNGAVSVYSVVSKIYTASKQIVIAGVMVTIPRISFYFGQKNIGKYNRFLDNLLNIIVIFTLPIFVGLAMLARPVVLIISGPEYLDGVLTLRLLCFASVFSILSYFFSFCILIPNRQDKQFVIATTIAAIVNIGLNFILIPIYSHKGAAVTTVMAEFIVMLYSWYHAKKYVEISFNKSSICSIIVGSVVIAIVCVNIINLFDNVFFQIVISILLSIVCYLIVMIVMKNSYILGVLRVITGKLVEHK